MGYTFVKLAAKGNGAAQPSPPVIDYLHRRDAGATKSMGAACRARSCLVGAVREPPIPGRASPAPTRYLCSICTRGYGGCTLCEVIKPGGYCIGRLSA